MADLIAARRDDPREDLLSDLIAAEEEGDRLSTEELVMLAEAVLLAGTDTTRNQLACALAVFAEHPDQWAMLAEHPELAPRAAEESLRYLGAVLRHRPVRLRRHRVSGHPVPTGDARCSRTSWPPTTTRRASTHPASSTSPHSGNRPTSPSASAFTTASGRTWARAELQEALVIMSQRMPNLRLDGEPVYKPAGVGIWGPASLPLAFDPT
ncbi:MAG: cytochrome P450 [Acidimicrobiales bacterium]